MLVFDILFAKIVVIVPVPHAQLNVELDLRHLLVAVTGAQLVEEVQSIDIEANVGRNLLLLGRQPALPHLAVPDGLLQALKHSRKVLDIGPFLGRLEEVLELLENGFRRHQHLVPNRLAFLPAQSFRLQMLQQSLNGEARRERSYVLQHLPVYLLQR
jgi:hypothetical protein